MTISLSDHGSKFLLGSDGDQAGGFGSDLLGLGGSLNQFIALVDAVIAFPNPFVAAGQNGATASQSQLFWDYNSFTGLDLRTSVGFLTTATGNGGFNLHVGTDGSWTLSFDGSKKVIGSREGGGRGAGAGAGAGTTTPPASAAPTVDLPSGPQFYNASTQPPETIDGGTGYDTIQGGIGDTMIGGSGTLGGGLGGDGNCAYYTYSDATAGPILVDMQNGFGYGGNAEGDAYTNINQVRGSLSSNVLIGNANGTDLKSGGNDSVLISTGGRGFELRPDGSGNVLVSTVGADRVVFTEAHGWVLGDAGNIMLGFNAAHGDTLDLTALTGGANGVLNGLSEISNFRTTSAAEYSAATGTGNIDDYVKIVAEADGSHVLFGANGQVATAGVEILDLKGVFGLNVDTLYQHGNILA